MKKSKRRDYNKEFTEEVYNGKEYNRKETVKS